MTSSTEKSDASMAAVGSGGELHQMAGGAHPPLTTNQGLPIADNQNSLRSSVRGPTLLEDFILREKITHFDHERIPERVVHARGTAAHGYFELTHSLAQYTTANILCEQGKRTPVFCRFSTVAGGAGSVDTPRDVRGFAVKFYTDQGNWDLVGNNIPVFFIQDAIKFPDLVHAVKMEPDRGFPQAASAHDNFWDFITLTPESMHMIMWVMSDRTLPRSLRMIEGFGIHSFRLVNADGDSCFVKFHWRPRLGLQSTLWDEAVKIAGADQDFHRRDLYESIDQGQFPEWDLAVQLFTEREADDFAFDHLDPTKIIPEEVVPLTHIGHMVLNRNVDNFFAETEQVAFCPSHLVPGIDFSNDPLLQGRLFSYLDTQLFRLGSPNFHQLPINMPKCPLLNHQRDGYMQHAIPKGRVNYEPSSLQDDSPFESPEGFHSFPEVRSVGSKGRSRSPSFSDHYSQARMFYRSQNSLEQAHMAAALIFELSKVETVHVRERMVSHLVNIDPDLAQRVAKGLGMEVPEAARAVSEITDVALSPATALMDRAKQTLKGRTVGILIADGTDAASLQALREAIQQAEGQAKLVAMHIGGALLSDDTRATADGQLAGSPSVLFDAVALLLSDAAGAAMALESEAVNFVRDAYAHLKAIAVSDGARAVIRAAGVEEDAGVVSADDIDDFVQAAKTRQWNRESSVHTLP